jgi:diketogulonate reductase-like aldo/keto reductase
MNKKKVLLPKKPSQSLTPWLWIGTWSMGGEGFGAHDERESLDVLNAAVKNNIRHFDTAGFYAHGNSSSAKLYGLRGRSSSYLQRVDWSGRGGGCYTGHLRKSLNNSSTKALTD